MSEDLTLFADRSPEEIEAIFDAYFEYLPHDVFFGILALMDEIAVSSSNTRIKPHRPKGRCEFDGLCCYCGHGSESVD